MSLAHLGAESFRLRLLAQLEAEFSSAGYSRIAGVDEVGRGCLAGPVVAAAVIPDRSRLIPGVADSKQIGPGLREQVAERIRETAVAWCVASIAPDVIDRVNILEATKQAMRQALSKLRPKAELALIDAVKLELRGLPCLPVVRGDHMSYAIAAASILAKVERDRMMKDLDSEYPQYGFSSNKGYGAPEHMRALGEFGPTPVHRLTFGSVLPSRSDAKAARLEAQLG